LYISFNSGIFVVIAVNVNDTLSDYENFTSAENEEDEPNYGSNEVKNETDEVKVPHIDERQLLNSKEQLGYADEAQIHKIPLKSSPQSLQIEWTAESETPITIFRLQFMSDSMPDWSEVEVVATKQDNNDWYGKTDLINLTPHTQYRVKVASRNNEGYNKFSKEHIFTTPRAGPVKQKAVSLSSSSKFSVTSLLCLICFTSILISSDEFIN